MKPSSNSVALAGEFAVLSRLALSGYDANLTLGNTKGVDILVSDPNGSMFRIEVKTRFHPRGTAKANSKFWGPHFSWLMNKKHEAPPDPKLWYCFVNILGSTESEPVVEFYAVPSAVVSAYVKAENAAWMKADATHKKGPMRTFRLGFEGGDYPVTTPFAADYRADWLFGIS